MPLQIVLRNLLVINQVDASTIADASDMAEKEGLKELLKYSLIIVASLPIMCVYPFVQKYFVKGVMIGSIKG
jgi:ABC-type glycerol-3-phosphate transport system permease component